MFDGGIRHRSFLEAKAYIETEDARNSPLGMGEAETVSFEVRQSTAVEDAVEVRVGTLDPIHVPVAVLREAVKVGTRRS